MFGEVGRKGASLDKVGRRKASREDALIQSCVLLKGK
jgi:hypothetical protein